MLAGPHRQQARQPPTVCSPDLPLRAGYKQAGYEVCLIMRRYCTPHSTEHKLRYDVHTMSMIDTHTRPCHGTVPTHIPPSTITYPSHPPAECCEGGLLDGCEQQSDNQAAQVCDEAVHTLVVAALKANHRKLAALRQHQLLNLAAACRCRPTNTPWSGGVHILGIHKQCAEDSREPPPDA